MPFVEPLVILEVGCLRVPGLSDGPDFFGPQQDAIFLFGRTTISSITQLALLVGGPLQGCVFYGLVMCGLSPSLYWKN